MKRKKVLFIFISLCVLACLCLFGDSVDITRAAASSADEQIEESVEEQLSRLDLKALEEYLQSLDGYSDESLTERLIGYVKGADFDYTGFGNRLSTLFFAKVREILPAFACIAAVTLLSGLISTLKSSSGEQTSSEMIFLITYAAALIPFLSVLTEVFSQSMQGISEMREQMQIIYPLLLTLMAAGGGSVSAAVCRPAVAFFSTTIVSTVDGVVLPLTITIIAFSMAGKLTKELKISKFTDFFKSMNKWIIGVCISVFGIFFTLQGITAASYDGVARRAAKYAIGTGIPIVGGFLSGGFDLAVAGSVLIKNSLGSMSIFLMLSVLFEPLVLLIAVNVLLRLTAAVTQPFGESRISDFLGETADNLHYCTAALLITAFLYFLTVLVMIFSAEAVL